MAGVAHEVNNPIGAISSAADASDRCIQIVDRFVTERGDEEPRLRKAITILGESNDIVTTASKRVASIVRSLRNFSRLDEAEFQKADVHEGIDSTLENDDTTGSLAARTRLSLTGGVETFVSDGPEASERNLKVHEMMVKEAIAARLAYLETMARLLSARRTD